MIYGFSHKSLFVIRGGVPHTIASDHEHYEPLRAAIISGDETEVDRILTAPRKSLELIARFGRVEVFAGHVAIDGQPIDNYLVKLILQAGDDMEPLARFLENVSQNPSRRAVQDLSRWCEAGNMPITTDGHILAYKIVRHDFKDCYTGSFDNSPGRVVQVPRNAVDDNPDVTCSHGLHFCSASYLPHYGPGDKRVVLVKVSPADVVAFPKDYNLSKARCCRYEVLQEIPAGEAAKFFEGHTGWYSVEDEDEFEPEYDSFSDEFADMSESEQQHIIDRIQAIGEDLGSSLSGVGALDSWMQFIQTQLDLDIDQLDLDEAFGLVEEKIGDLLKRLDALLANGAKFKSAVPLWTRLIIIEQSRPVRPDVPNTIAGRVEALEA